MLCDARPACDTSVPSRSPAGATPADATACRDGATTTLQSFADVPATSDPERALGGESEPRADITERRLLAAISSRGSRSALRRLHSLYHSRLAQFFLHLVPRAAAEVIDDLIADTMYDVWRMSASLGRSCSIHVAIMRIAWEHGSKHLAHRKVHVSPPHAFSKRPELRTWLSTTEGLRPFSDVLATLHVTERAVVQLAYSGHSRQEVADILSMSCQAVDAYLASSMIALQPWLAARYSSTTGD